jgi:hypothetical protein
VPQPRLKTSLHTLTEALVESVMNAIRLASLEELMGRTPRSSTPHDVRLDPPQVREGRPRRQARAPEREAAPRERARPSAPPVVVPLLLEDISTAPEPASEITDPQMLLALGIPDVDVPIPPPRAPAPVELTLPPSRFAYTNGEARPVRLRDNESVARVSGAGVVIRRAR